MDPGLLTHSPMPFPLDPATSHHLRLAVNHVTKATVALDVEIITAVSTPPTCRVLNNLKDPFIIIIRLDLTNQQLVKGSTELKLQTWALEQCPCLLGFRAPLRTEARRGKKTGEAADLPWQRFVISQFLNLSHLILFKH